MNGQQDNEREGDITMFFKKAVFKRLLKSAYKGVGLTVGREKKANEDGEIVRDGYYIAGGYWVIWVDIQYITKEAKAAIIELCGELPEPGEAFTAHKEGGNQYKMGFEEVYDLPEVYKKCKTRFRISKTILKSSDALQRLLQACDKTNHIVAINEVFMDLIEPDAVDYENGEREPDGPIAGCAMSKYILWGNEVCYLMACTRKIDDQETKDYLEYLEAKEII